MPLQTILRGVKKAPGIRHWNQQRKLDFYLSPRGYGAHWGRFESFAEARAWLPASPEFQLETLADEYLEIRTQRVYTFDYPVMYWLRRAMEAGAARIFDIGGSVGVHYFAYRKYLPDYPPALEWHVSDLPLVTRRGRELAARENEPSLTFTDAMDASLIDHDVWLAAGVLEFIEDSPLDQLLAQARRRPQHVLLNKLPLHEGDDFVSTQNIGHGCFVPHRVYNRARYVAGIEALGYRLVDSWDVPERSFIIPGQPAASFDAYTGLYFRRT